MRAVPLNEVLFFGSPSKKQKNKEINEKGEDKIADLVISLFKSIAPAILGVKELTG